MTDEQILKKLEEIETHLRNLDRRDRVRMVWSSLHTMVNLGVLLVAIFGSVYFVQHFTDLVKTMVQQSAQQTSNSFKEQIQQYFK
jgi:nitrogen fixation/metabolism regulation signal transduction histidine kinase